MRSENLAYKIMLGNMQDWSRRPEELGTEDAPAKDVVTAE
jgi:hypothetical protein